MIAKKLSRRQVLRGMLKGAAVSMSLPILDCFLNESGTAWASGAPLPVRFGTWHWGCGMNRDRWVPKTVGADYDVPVELKPMEPYKHLVNVLSDFRVMLDGKANHVHFSGNAAVRTGVAPTRARKVEAPSFDTFISRHIGKDTRFRSLEIACTGRSAHSYSWQSANVTNPAETSPAALYTRIFGSGFQDPNVAEFTPDPRALAMQSVLSVVSDDRRRLIKQVGAADRQRLDQFFTSVRQLEQQIELQLQKPAPLEACSVPAKTPDTVVGSDIEVVKENHRLFSRLLAMALACNQTKVFNLVFSDSASSLVRSGLGSTHHVFTHEEPFDEELGYQIQSTWFLERSMEAWGEFLQALTEIPEGSGTLLDNCLVLAMSDCEVARFHTVDGIPMMIAGKAGGRVKTGLHIPGNNDPVTRVGLTLQMLMGVAVNQWGTKSLATSKPINEIVA